MKDFLMIVVIVLLLTMLDTNYYAQSTPIHDLSFYEILAYGAKAILISIITITGAIFGITIGITTIVLLIILIGKILNKINNR